MEEQWKVYKKTKLTLWEISDMGNVKKNGLPYICGKSNTGYYCFSDVFLHRAVAELFVPNPDPVHKTNVDHIDGNKLNNCAWNLRWCSQKDNLNNLITRKRMSESHIGLQAGENNPFYSKHHSEESKKKMSYAKKGEKSFWFGKHHSEETKKKMRNAQTLKPVICLKDNKVIKIYDALRDVKIDGFQPNGVWSCCKGIYKSHKGFNWMYLSDYEKRQG